METEVEKNTEYRRRNVREMKKEGNKMKVKEKEKGCREVKGVDKGRILIKRN